MPDQEISQNFPQFILIYHKVTKISQCFSW